MPLYRVLSGATDESWAKTMCGVRRASIIKKVGYYDTAGQVAGNRDGAKGWAPS